MGDSSEKAHISQRELVTVALHDLHVLDDAEAERVRMMVLSRLNHAVIDEPLPVVWRKAMEQELARIIVQSVQSITPHHWPDRRPYDVAVSRVRRSLQG